MMVQSILEVFCWLLLLLLLSSLRDGLLDLFDATVKPLAAESVRINHPKAKVSRFLQQYISHVEPKLFKNGK